MKYSVIALILLFLFTSSVAQKTLLLEKIGTSRKYYYHLDDKIMLKTSKLPFRMKGRLSSIDDSIISIYSGVYSIKVHDIAILYRDYGFPRRLAVGLGEAGVVYFLIISFNNLINKEQVFTPYTYLITGSCIAGSLVSFSLVRHHFQIGYRWKLKILDFTLK